MAGTPLEALEALAASLGEDAPPTDLERALPIVTRTLKQALRSDSFVDLGETEPAYGLRFDVGGLRGEAEDSDGTS